MYEKYILLLLLSSSISTIFAQFYGGGYIPSYGGIGATTGIGNGQRQQTVLVPVYTTGYGGGGVYQGYGGYGMYPGYGAYPDMMAAGGGGMCCGQGGGGYGMMPRRESNAKRFFKGATEGLFMGSIGMFGSRK